jgi:tetratricopeptide (TPR) repeat protein
MSRSLPAIALGAVLFTGVCLGDTRPSIAAPSVWAAARRPNAAAREALVDQSDKAQNDAAFEKERAKYTGNFLGDDVGRIGRIEAQFLLEQAGGANSPNMMVRLRYASVMRNTAQDRKPQDRKGIESATKILETVLSSRPAPAIALLAWDELAICSALLGQREKEIRAYTEALALEPLGPRRAMLLANRAESHMALGHLDDAIRGYQESLASIHVFEMPRWGVTTLWGLGVALDRNGDLDSALEQIRMAREYDRFDVRINDDGWFYSPPHDEHWYKALGAWARARAASNSVDRTFEYGHALEAWERYIYRAPANDPYVALAKARHQACEKERERSGQVAQKP